MSPPEKVYHDPQKHTQVPADPYGDRMFKPLPPTVLLEGSVKEGAIKHLGQGVRKPYHFCPFVDLEGCF